MDRIRRIGTIRWRAHRAVRPFVLTAVVLLAMSLSVPSPAGERFVYDDLGRLVETVDEAGNQTTHTYDAVRNFVSVKSLAAAVNILAVKSSSGTVPPPTVASTVPMLAANSVNPDLGPVQTRVSVATSGAKDPVRAEPALGLPVLSASAVKTTAACVDLGRQLFSDRTLSADGKISCASCHVPSKAFTDGRVVAVGRGGQRGTRNVPSLLNVAWQSSLFWDGRTKTLEAQVTKPLFNPLEHGLADEDELLRIVRSSITYRSAFAHAFPESRGEISMDQIASALVCYERTLVGVDSPFDRFEFGGDRTALSPSALRGLELFRGRAGCVTCHRIDARDATFTDGKFHRRGIGLVRAQANLGATVARVTASAPADLDRLIVGDARVSELGRFVVTREPMDIGSFKTPSLRNIALTAPYMHDGSIATLREAVVSEAYYGAAEGAPPVLLSAPQVTDLVEFLNSLTSTALRNDTRESHAVAPSDSRSLQTVLSAAGGQRGKAQ